MYPPAIVGEEIKLGDFGADLAELDRSVFLGASVHTDRKLGAAPPAGNILGAKRFGQ